MKIMNRLTIRFLRENKRRTILTILCISMSIVMLSCIGISLSSGKQFYKDYVEENIGDYHYVVSANKKETLEHLKKYDFIEKYFIRNYIDYSLNKTTELNHSKKSLTIEKGDRNYFIYEKVNDYLIEGRIPNASGEIVLSKKIIEARNMNISIGDDIQLYLYDDKPETFKIVGIIDDFKSKNEYKIEQDGLIYLDTNVDDSYFEIYVTDKDVSNKIFDHAQIIKEENSETDIIYNSSYLAVQDIFEENSQSFILNIYKIFSLLVVIIICISVLIINQAFNLSINDRIKYLGMLSSVGATPKQKRKSIYFEGFILSFIAIPLGLLISFLGLSITFSLLNNLDIIKNLGVNLSVHVSLNYIMLIIIISLLTIFISLYLPAKKVSKITVIDSLRNSDNVKVKSKKMRNNFISRKLMSFPTQLAFRNYKRQGRQSKFIIISLIVSMVAFVSIFSFGNLLNKDLDEYQKYMDHDILISINASKENIEKTNKILDENKLVKDYNYEFEMYVEGKLDENYYDVNDKELKYIYNENNGSIILRGWEINRIKEVCKKSKIDYNEKTLYVNSLKKGKEYIHYKKMDKKFIQELWNDVFIEESGDYENENIDLDFFNDIKVINNGLIKWDDNINFIMPINQLIEMIPVNNLYNMEYYVYATDSQALEDYLNSIEGDFYIRNDAVSQQQQRQMFIIIKTFIYGFVAIMILFTILNMINIMNSSIYKRKKEFAMMMSVGISPNGLRKMILKESFIYGFKTLLYGLPLSVFVESRFYNRLGYNSTFTPSYLAYFISFITIVIIMIIVFKVSLRTLNKQNIIESLKEDM